jgi:hypothetical protein
MIEMAVLLNLLAPAVPFLVGLSSKVGEGAAQSIGTDIWSQVKAKLGGKLAGHSIAQPAIAQLKQEPENANLQAMVQMALKDLLEKDQGLAAELGELLQGAKPTPTIQVEIESTGDHNKNVGVNYGQM